MGLKEGTTCFLKLDSFEPPWRQAVLLAEVSSGKKLIFAVRLSAGEARSEEAKKFSLFDCSGERYILVEGTQAQVRTSCPREIRGLEIPAYQVFAAGKETLEQSPDLVYATASEELEVNPPAGRTTRLRTKLGDSSSEDSAEEEDEASEDDLFRMLRKAAKAGTGRDTSLEKDARSSKAAKSRYPLLGEKGKPRNDASASSSGVEALLQQSLSTGSLALTPENVNALISMELLRTLKSKPRKTRSSARSDGPDVSDGSSLESSSSHGKKGGASRALRNYRRGHRSMRKNPGRHIRRYIKEVEEFLGATRETPYQLSDFTRRLNWGKQKSLLRVHFAISEALQTLLRNQPELAALELVQLLRAVHQTCLDNGSWRASWLLTRHPDPCDVPRFGGEPQELERVAGYLDALQKLEKRSKGIGKGDQEDESAKGKRGKGNAKKKSDEAKED
eukprot:Skav235005  [mRNA]  locus=scaffold276:29989:31329:+ [translate_table: standard]